ncbi:MAG TPA: M23 family metallopeptidase [Gemmatimonadaceae bacterium]|nr:M23 family metallopeptidase [Gemmatimonadaceae bacterium]
MRSFSVLLATVLAAPAVAQTVTPRFTAMPARPQPGAVVRLSLTLPATDSVQSVEGRLAGEPLHFVRRASSWRAIGGVPTDAEGNVSARAYVRFASGRVDTMRATMVLPPIPKRKAEPLRVDSSFSRPMDAETAARVARENALAREVGRKSHETPRLWTAAFLKPRESRVTSVFGSGRVFNGSVQSRHLGVDYAGAVGAPILAANRGVVALVDSFFLAGNVVYVDHGAGVVTGYFHMSKALVSVGDTVSRGQRIGEVGQTGRVTGPHLHWSARYGTITVNPNDLIALARGW